MNFYVVSPNVYNDGNVDYYKNEMLDRHIVIMGYSKEDGNKWVKMFNDTMNIGDCVIVARGANWQKQVFFAGIISSESMTYTEEGESLYREIQYLTDLSNDVIPFNIDCAYGASRQSGSIYQLKPDSNPADKAVTDIVAALIAQTVSSQMNKKRSYSLKDISTWPNAIVSLPGVQRGLVWKPAQVELLWDSILRGFPIGTFTLSETDISEQNSKYYLMDGQQRFNAIALGFSTIQEKSPIIWLDINPKISSSSTRKFLVRLTTIAHPWGYKDDDSCSVLSTEEKRSFLDQIGRQDSVYKKVLNPNECYPYKANKPIPLSWLLNAPVFSEKDFCDYLIRKIENTKLTLPYKQFTEEDVDLLKNIYFKLFKNVKDYCVGVSIISSEAIDRATNEDKREDQPEALEVLFRRIGTGGTQITQEELNYSAIKAYWPQELREENDNVAEKYMNSERLIRLVFRLVLTLDDITKGNNDAFKTCVFQKDLSIQRIRKIGKERDGILFKKIFDWYKKDGGNSKISIVMGKVDYWLTYDKCPKFLRTSIARNSPDVYLLMMFFASEFEKIQLSDEQIRLLQGIAYYLHWFADKNKGLCANIILSEYIRCRTMPEQALFAGVLECIRQNRLPLICPPSFLKMQQNSHGGLEHLDDRCGQTWNLISQNRELLLFAQREYLNQKFPNYDPAQRGMWEQHNRPWDLDHIVPQDWINNKRGNFRDYCKKWLWKNGNFAAISFEANRSKNNQADWSEYDTNKDYLLFDDRFKAIKPELAYKKDLATNFGKIVFDRTKSIYSNCYEKLFRHLVEDVKLPEPILRRKQVLTDIKNCLRKNDFGVSIRWVDDYFSMKEFEIEEQSALSVWCHAWLTVGFTPDKYYYICVCTQDGKTLEIGVRKHPNEQVLNGEPIPIIDDYNNNNSNWWYLVKEIQYENYKIEKICEELRRLNNHIASPMNKES